MQLEGGHPVKICKQLVERKGKLPLFMIGVES
jgi:hypothetical protein